MGASFSFVAQTSGMINISATGTAYQRDQPERSIQPSFVKEITLTPDGKKVVVTLNDFSHYTIDPVVDSVVLGNTTIAANTYQTGAALKAQFDGSTVFKKANTGSGGTGTTDYNALNNKPFTSAEVTKLKALLNVDNTAQ